MISDQIGRGWVLADEAQIFAFADTFSGPTVLAIAPAVDVIVLLLDFFLANIRMTQILKCIHE